MELEPYDRMTAIVAARLVAEEIHGIMLDDRVLFAFERTALAAHERLVREKVAQEIKAAAKDAAKTDSPDAILGLIVASHIASGTKARSFDDLADELDAAIARGAGGQGQTETDHG